MIVPTWRSAHLSFRFGIVSQKKQNGGEAAEEKKKPKPSAN